jgi:hypothetical protein
MARSDENAHSELFEGGYYSIVDGERVSVAKILKLEPDKVHVRIYKQQFSERPRSIDPSLLTLGTIHDQDGFGMSHLPLRLETFRKREPAFLTYAEVAPDELKGYEVWREIAQGAVFE